MLSLLLQVCLLHDQVTCAEVKPAGLEMANTRGMTEAVCMTRTNSALQSMWCGPKVGSRMQTTWQPLTYFWNPSSQNSAQIW